LLRALELEILRIIRGKLHMANGRELSNTGHIISFHGVVVMLKHVWGIMNYVKGKFK